MMKNFLLKKLITKVDGNATIELALIMTVMAAVIVLGVDYSRMTIEKHRLEQFARAGAQYGLLGQSEAQDLVGVAAAVSAAAGADAADITITATNFCECPDGSSTLCTDDCSGVVPDLFLTVAVSKDFDYLFALGSSLTGAITLEGAATVRVR
ncbi:MAG: TadE/TadG family type IV pilus assembly protein [Alphaproteobacteria bacterium]